MDVRIEHVTDEDRRDLVALRRDLHRHPELAFREERTAAIAAGAMRELGMEVREGVGGTGVVGLLGAADAGGRCLMLRADMDALPVDEAATGRPYRSREEGRMHACGHDGHVATLVVALRILARQGRDLGGLVKAVFQPAEETGGGARAMIADGVLEDPRPDAVLGLHYWSYIPTGTVGVRPGPTMASVDEFAIHVRGGGGHAALPHRTADALVAASAVVSALQTVVSRRTDPLQPAVVTVGTFHAGTAFNVIPEEARLTGTVRTFDDEVWRAVPGHVEEVVRGVCAAHGCTCEIRYDRHIQPLVNDPAMAEVVRGCAEAVVGGEAIVDLRTMGGEDMGEFLARVPGCFFFVGARNEDRGITAPHHHPEFDLDEEALVIGCELLVRSALAALSS